MMPSTGFLLALFALAAGCHGAQGEPAGEVEARPSRLLSPGSPRLKFVKIETVKESDGAALVALTGRVGFDEDHTQRVASPIDGRVTALLVRPGDRVKVGQALVELSSQVVGQLQADALKAQQDLGLAQKAIERGRKLMVDGAISAKELAQLEADVRKATSDAARTAAQLRSLGVSASEPAVSVALRARVDGVVVERSALVGQEVRADSTEPLLTISELGTVWVLADAYEQDLGLVQVGATVSVRVPAYPGETFAGKVVHVHDAVDPDTRTVKVRCVLPNPGGRLKPEMFAKVELSSQGGPHAIVLPSSAVLNDGDQSIVLVVNEDHSFQSAKVDVGPELGGKVRILSGLVAGQRVVTQGALFLQREQATP
ncbi:MAG TPA: efflux RND transporter periplasmic adaptor subunit [Pseudomonadota bacterium]|nr:efflux RND transporter periplasmic adaptor subunit [Pseudomonadota bacterium]